MKAPRRANTAHTQTPPAGKSALTEAYNASNEAILKMLLEHPSAAELEKNKDKNVRVVGAGDEDPDADGASADAAAAADANADADASSAAAAASASAAAASSAKATSARAEKAKVVQAYTHTMSFKEGSTPLLVREIGTDWFGEVFTEHAQDDTTGIQLWAASLVMARCVISSMACMN